MKRTHYKATIQDVADAAGVSIATVSRTLSAKDRVNEETQLRVIRAIKETGYKTDMDILSKKRSNTILVGADIENPFYVQVIDGVSFVARQKNYEVLIWKYGGVDLSYTQEDLIQRYKTINPAGIILMVPTNPANVQVIDHYYPIIQCCEYSTTNLPYVSIDNYQASCNVVDYLLSCGRKKIAFINGDTGYKYAAERERGFYDTMAKNGVSVNQNWILQKMGCSADSISSSMLNILMNDDRPDAVFATSDLFAAITLKAARQCGLSLPKDLFVIGFDNTFIGNLSEPPLTTIVQPQFQMGSMACEMLFERINGKNIQNKSIKLNAELLIRESTKN